MPQRQFDEIRLRNFRCFSEQQTARLAPLTLLIGDNSTGKTSFLAAVRAIWDAAYQQIEPDFRASPYDLGAFSEIIYSQGRGGSNTFDIGFSGRVRDRYVDVDITFESRSASPYPAAISLNSNDTWIKYVPNERNVGVMEFGTADCSWRSTVHPEYLHNVPWGPFFVLLMAIKPLESDSSRLEMISGSTDSPDADTIERIASLLEEFAFTAHEKPFASAPIRSSPHRTYDPTRPLPDPEGAYIPTYFANIQFRDKSRWKDLKDQLEKFGNESGLFHEISVRQLGDMEGGPFQLEIRRGGMKRKGRKRNLIDVGYGVSQILPVLAELFRPEVPPLFLFQQPEVHLHPSAQAALGSLFCATAANGRQLVIETHSDYIVDRILLDVRDKRTMLKPDDISILYFDREDLDVTIHSIRIDDEGNVIDPPDGYRSFFRDELKRVIDY